MGEREGSARAARSSLEHRRRYRLGRFAEWVAVALLLAKGYRVLARRARTPVGEIDIIALRGRRLAFIEVKHRPTRAQAITSLTPRQQRRIMRASEYWLVGHPRFRVYERAFDLILLAPGQWPRHMQNIINATFSQGGPRWP